MAMNSQTHPRKVIPTGPDLSLSPKRAYGAFDGTVVAAAKSRMKARVFVSVEQNGHKSGSTS
jgi:hypothetical protein